jgi:hypothetical protein
VCTADADCGRNSLCVDLEFGLPEDQRSGEASMACVPACWGI